MPWDSQYVGSLPILEPLVCDQVKYQPSLRGDVLYGRPGFLIVFGRLQPLAGTGIGGFQQIAKRSSLAARINASRGGTETDCLVPPVSPQEIGCLVAGDRIEPRPQSAVGN